jgi:hypothetical protein
MYSGRLGTVEDTAGWQVTPVSGGLRDGTSLYAVFTACSTDAGLS